MRRLSCWGLSSSLTSRTRVRWTFLHSKKQSQRLESSLMTVTSSNSSKSMIPMGTAVLTIKSLLMLSLASQLSQPHHLPPSHNTEMQLDNNSIKIRCRHQERLSLIMAVKWLTAELESNYIYAFYNYVSPKPYIENIRERIKARGARGIIGLARVFKIIDDNGSRSLS